MIEVNDLSVTQYSVSKNIRFKTTDLRSDLCDYSDAYNVVKRRIAVTITDAADRRNKKLTLKINSPFRSCISKINDSFIGNPEDFDIDMSMYNLWKILRIIIEMKWMMMRIKITVTVIGYIMTATSKSFEYKTKVIGNTPADISRLDSEGVVPLRCFSNLWRSPDLPLISLICHGHKIA